ncbi:hypothetical protein Amn_03360 [Aminobacter sp. Y103A]|nr:hypothetical protein Amn_03360 [Aminobacter sp. SS-2016]
MGAKAIAVELLRTPLWPTGHLPRKGGDWQLRRSHLSSNLDDWRRRQRRLISPLAGEMAAPLTNMGPEGGAKDRRPRNELLGTFQ